MKNIGSCALISAAILAVQASPARAQRDYATELKDAIEWCRQGLGKFNAAVVAARSLEHPRDQYQQLAKAREDWEEVVEERGIRAGALLDSARDKSRIARNRLNEFERDIVEVHLLWRGLVRATDQRGACKPGTYVHYRAMRESLHAWRQRVTDSIRRLEWTNSPQSEKRWTIDGEETVEIVRQRDTWNARLRQALDDQGVAEADTRFTGAGFDTGAYGISAGQRQGLGWKAYTTGDGRYKPLHDALRHFAEYLDGKEGEPSAADARYFVYAHWLVQEFGADEVSVSWARARLPSVVAFRWKVQLRIDRRLKEIQQTKDTAERNALGTSRAQLVAIEALARDLDSSMCTALKAAWTLEVDAPQRQANGTFVLPAQPKHGREEAWKARRDEFDRALYTLMAEERAIK
jgi:hypothetical protein